MTKEKIVPKKHFPLRAKGILCLDIYEVPIEFYYQKPTDKDQDKGLFLNFDNKVLLIAIDAKNNRDINWYYSIAPKKKYAKAPLEDGGAMNELKKKFINCIGKDLYNAFAEFLDNSGHYYFIKRALLATQNWEQF